MKGLYYSIYTFYTTIILEKEIPVFYSAGMISVLFSLNFTTIMNIITVKYFLIEIQQYSLNISIVFNVILLIIFYLYFKKKQDYIFLRYKNKSMIKKRIYYFLSALYIVLTFVLFFLSSNLVRDFNDNMLKV